jgi:hypothetical protein
MSSHREAPEISRDPVADSADLYAFVSPDSPSTVTIIANYVPLQQPAGGPNFYEFGDDVLYEVHIDNDGDARADITYQFRFRRPVGRLRQPVNPEPPSCRLTRWLRVDQGQRRCDNTCIPTLARPTTLTPVKFHWPGRHPGRPTRAVR